jgi:FkbM family methyltransferase
MPHAACYQAFGRDFWIEPASSQFANAVFHDEYQINDLRPHDVRTVVDVGAHVGSFTLLCYHYWPNARIVAVEPHPESFELLERNTKHIPREKLTLINAAVTQKCGRCLLSSPVSHSRVSEYVPDLWNALEPRASEFGIVVDSISTEDLWTILREERIEEVDLMKLDCEGAEYAIFPDLARIGAMPSIGWIRGEWHCRRQNPILSSALARTHAFNIDPNLPHEVGLFIAHRL